MSRSFLSSWAFIIAIIAYAGLSNPTPDAIGWIEYGVIGLLICALGLSGGIYSLIRTDIPRTLSMHRLFVIYMICVPLGTGLIYGHPTADIIRDIIPIACLILPLWLWDFNPTLLARTMVIGGGLFALRYIIPYTPFRDVIPWDIPQQSLLYLANSPLVLFAAIYGFGLFLKAGPSITTQWMWRLVGLICCALALCAMAMMMQRATLTLAIISCLIILGLSAQTKPVASMIIGALIMVGVIYMFPVIETISSMMASKHFQVGWNNRWEELSAIANDLSIFGGGWGMEWQSPAVADIWVRFSHNMIGYYALKTGVIGAILTLTIYIIWGTSLVKLFRNTPVMGLAIGMPFMVHTILYTGFKTLDFALIVSLLILCARKQNPS